MSSLSNLRRLIRRLRGSSALAILLALLLTACVRRYPEGRPSRFFLERLRSAAQRWPNTRFSQRVLRNIADMIDGDGAAIYKVPGLDPR